MPTRTVGDREWESEGSFLVFAQPWSALTDKTLQRGRDYSDSISWAVGDLARATNVQLKWQWPAAWRRTRGVYGYVFMSWGSHEGGLVRVPVAPRTIGSLKELSFRFGLDPIADPSEYNGLMETFLTSTWGGGGRKAIEVGWLWHAPAETRTWAATGRQLGDFTDRFGRRWNVSVRPGDSGVPYVTFIPASGFITWGSIDAKAGFDHLVSAGLVDRNWWFNGMAMGVEPLSGSGSLFIRGWTPTYR